MTPVSTPLDLAALRKIAEGATEGPWRIYTVTDSGGRSAAVETAWAHDEQGEDTELVTDWCAPEDAAHIVAFDPPTVLALIALAEKWEDRAGETAAKMIDATARAEAAEATVTRVRDRRDNWADMLKHVPGPHEGTPLEFVSIAVDSLTRALDGSS